MPIIIMSSFKFDVSVLLSTKNLPVPEEHGPPTLVLKCLQQ